MTTPNKPTLPFHQDMVFDYGTLQAVGAGVRRLVCHNPGALTFKGTNTYVVGEGAVAVIDPGPKGEENMDALLRELGDETITHIVLTHCHSDHSGAAASLAARTGAKTYGMLRAKDDPALNTKAPSGNDFITPVAFTNPLAHGDGIEGDGWRLQALHTPGHAPDHLCFHFTEQNTLFSGDHVMGWNTSVIAPPEGHMGRYLASLEALLERDEAIYYPGHGGLVSSPQRYVKTLIMHRRWREGEIAQCLQQGLRTIDEIIPAIYQNLEPKLERAAGLNVLAHLELMVEQGQVALGKPGPLDRHQEFVPVGKE